MSVERGRPGRSGHHPTNASADDTGRAVAVTMCAADPDGVIRRPRLAVVDGERARRRYRLGGQRRRRRFSKSLDRLLGIGAYSDNTDIEPMDYRALMLDRGVPERVVAGRWSA